MFRHLAKIKPSHIVKSNQNKFLISPLSVTNEYSKKYFGTKGNFSEFKQSGIYSALGIIGLAAGMTSVALAEKKETVKKFHPVEPSVSLDSIGGYSEIINNFTDVVQYLQEPSSYQGKPPKAILLSGPPGVGKSILAEAVAGTAGRPIFIVNCSSLIAGYVGWTEKNIRELFDSAKNIGPCVILLDEFDSIANKRFESDAEPIQASAHYANTVVNLLLTYLAGVHDEVVIIATTNHVNNLDPAVIRPGRFDKHIDVPLPNAKDREEIFSIHVGSKSFEMDIKHLAVLTEGYSGALIESLAQNAIKKAESRKSNIISVQDLDEAMEIIRIGSTGIINNNIEKRRLVAIHEIGHALVGYLLGMNLYKVSVKSYSNIQGVTLFIPNGEDTKDAILNEICIALAGRAADELYAKPQAGCENDFMKAKTLAKKMVKDEGMGETISGLDSDVEVEMILRTQMQRASTMLKENKEAYLRLVNHLVDENVLYREHFLQIIAGKKPQSQSSIWSWFYSPTATQHTQAKLPAKKKYVPPKSRNNTDDLPFTSQQVSSVLGFEERYIRTIREEGGHYFIRFKPDMMIEYDMRTMLRDYHVDHEFIFKHGSMELVIYKDGFDDFMRLLKHKKIDERRMENIHGY